MPTIRRPMTEAESTLAAEARAVEEGHRALLTGEKRNGMTVIKVVSDTNPGRWYNVTGTHDLTGKAVFECYANDPDFKHGNGKAVPCKHAAVAARRLEREGFLKWNDGAWWVTDKVARHVVVQPDDPFTGLPGIED